MSRLTLPRPLAGSRSRDVPRPSWRVAAVAAATAAVLPVAVVAVDALTPTPAVWAHLWQTRLPEMLRTTGALLVAVAAGTLVLGAGLAWIVSAYDFPGRRVLSWLLVLPIAMPAYVLGFVFLALFDYAGPVQSGLRAAFGPDAWFPEVRSVGGAAIVLSLTLYPYVYVLARSAINEQAAATVNVARTLGLGRLRTALRVVAPMARPSLAAGLALVMMETLTDFATVQYFNVQTVSVGVYRVWNGMLDREAATELAGLVLLVAIAVLAAERLLRGGARYHQRGGREHGVARAALRGPKAWMATGACASVLTATVLMPVAQLLWWSRLPTIRGARGVLDERFLTYLGNSGLLAALTAGTCVAVALLLGHGVRLSGDALTRRAAQLTMVGYAVPGVVVAVGVLSLFIALDGPLEALGMPGTRPLVTGTVLGVCYAYATRFLAVAYASVDASLQKVTPAMTMSALALRASPARVLRRVHLPLVRGGVAVAAVLVAIDALKELPMVLLLRPFGFNTLSVWVWQLAAESRWQDAALPALVIVVVAALPLLLLFRDPAGEAAGDVLPAASGGLR